MVVSGGHGALGYDMGINQQDDEWFFMGRTWMIFTVELSWHHIEAGNELALKHTLQSNMAIVKIPDSASSFFLAINLDLFYYTEGDFPWPSLMTPEAKNPLIFHQHSISHSNIPWYSHEISLLYQISTMITIVHYFDPINFLYLWRRFGPCLPQQVMVGDQCQLPATVLSQEAQTKGLDISMFDRSLVILGWGAGRVSWENPQMWKLAMWQTTQLKLWSIAKDCCRWAWNTPSSPTSTAPWQTAQDVSGCCPGRLPEMICLIILGAASMVSADENPRIGE